MSASQDDRFLKAVKLFNVVAGILLIAGTITLVVALFVRNSGGDDEAEPDEAEILQVGDAIELVAPVGSRIVDSQLDEGLVLVTVELPDGLRTLYLIEAKSGLYRQIGLGEP